MHMVMNIFIDLLIGTWILIKNFIMKRILWLFINKKTSHLIGPSQNEIFYIYSHSKFVIGIQYMM
jgi:hypothetical protein